MIRDARFSECGCYRWWLIRQWGDGPRIMFIGLNPSKAGAEDDDATVRLWTGYAQRWAYGSFVAVNLFAWIDTDPRGLRRAGRPVGDECDEWIRHWAHRSLTIMGCWGGSGGLSVLSRGLQVLDMLRRPVYCIGRTKAGQPVHVLRQRADATLQPYWSPA